MKMYTIILTMLIAPTALFGQFLSTDTIPASASYLKFGGEQIFETIVDTAFTIVINEFLARNSDFNYDSTGDDDDWFEIYNFGDEPIKLNKLWFTDNPSDPFKWQFLSDSSYFLEAGEHMLFWADEEGYEGDNHANFKLSGDGEYLAIYSKDSSLIDEIAYGSQSSNISYGRYPDGATSWNYFTIPSPGSENNESYGAAILPLPFSSHIGGFFSSPQNIHFENPVSNSEIRYTIDGNDPDESSLLYEGSVELSTSTILRARIVKDGYVSGPILTISCFFDDETYFENPVLSIVSDSANLYGKKGLITTKSSTLEIPGNFEFIVDSRSIYASGLGIQLHSAKSIKPYSLRFYARSRYGNEWFNFPFFEEEGPGLFKRLILRNSGNDNINLRSTNTHFRDPLAEKIAATSDSRPFISASRPVNVFLNGEFYGVFNMRERIDEYYIQTHTAESENYDLLERAFGFGLNRNAIVGSFDKWDELLTFVDTTGDLSLESDYNYVSSQVDIENFTDYWITEVFVGNYDWLSNNVKFWKSQHGKWQWIYWDMDHGLGLIFSNYGDVDWNTLEWSLTMSDRAWPNGYNNILIRNLLKNEAYKEFFIKRFAHMLNTSFAYKNTSPIYEHLKSSYENDLIKHTTHWNKSISDWSVACETINEYLKIRPTIQFEDLKDFFNLEEPVDVTINMLPPGAGWLSFGGNKTSCDKLDALYFPGMNYSLSYEPVPGFRLSEFLINGESYADSSSIFLSDSINIELGFLPEHSTLPLMISEVFFNNKEEYDCGDWMELYYYGFDTLDLGGMEICGDLGEVLYRFKNGVKIAPESYFIVSEDLQAFEKVFPDPIIAFGNLQSGFSSHLSFSLKSPTGDTLSQNELMTSPEWPVLPESGYSLELIKPFFESDEAQSWEKSDNIFGSPGLSNNLKYDFQNPLGVDSVFSNKEALTLRLSSSDDYYYDADGHNLAHILVTSVSGPGAIVQGINPIEKNTTYLPGDFTFSPSPPYDKPSEFSYRFIDESGQKSQIYRIQFKDLTGLKQQESNTLKHYPNPASKVLFLEFPYPTNGEIHFSLSDLQGRKIQEFRKYIHSELLEIDLSELPSGIYFYRVMTQNASYKGKIELLKE